MYSLGLMNLLGYIALTIYNLLWLLHPKVSALESVLSGCKRQPVGQSLGTVFDFSISLFFTLTQLIYFSLMSRILS